MGSFSGLGSLHDMYEEEAEPPHTMKTTEPSPTDFGAYPVCRQRSSV